MNDEYMHTHSIIKDAKTKIELISDEKKVHTCVDMHTHSIIKDAETKIELISDEKKVYTCVDDIYFSGYHGIW